MKVSRISRLFAVGLLCVMAFALVACKANSDSKVVGTWTLEKVYLPDGSLIPEEEMSKTPVTYEFSADTVKESWPDEETYDSPYTLSEDGHTATITYEDGHTEEVVFDEDFKTFSLLYENKAEPEYWGRTYVFTADE